MTVRERLVFRARMLARLRRFFDERGFFEVETPAYSPEVIPELHIEPIRIAGARPLFLQASPELHMKRLLCGGSGAIYQVTRVFRADEVGPLHNPQFTMVEWYRPGDGMAEGMALLAELIESVAPCSNLQGEKNQTNQQVAFGAVGRISYRDAFLRELGVDPFRDDLSTLASAASRRGVDLTSLAGCNDRDEWLNLLLATCVEPGLGRQEPEIVHHYPASQAALAAISRDGHGDAVAERFELYWRGVELANGYHELADAAGLRQRLEGVNEARASLGLQRLPLPESLLQTMADPGLPACAGVALGFDRLVMLAQGSASLDDALSYRE